MQARVRVCVFDVQKIAYIGIGIVVVVIVIVNRSGIVGGML